jgi:5-formyltetrahydrofolate cyclo-ligase
MTKQQARTDYLSRRLAMPDQVRLALSAQMLDIYKRIVFPPLKCIHVYQPILSRKEIDTLPFVEHLESLFPGLTLVVPRVSGATSLEHIIWDAATFFAPNAWGIPEPLEGLSVSPRDIDLVIVPLLIFDENGARVGYGKGLYDRFLATCRTDVLRVGLSLFDPASPLEDTEEFDVPLSIGITPTQLYEFV